MNKKVLEVRKKEKKKKKVRRETAVYQSPYNYSIYQSRVKIIYDFSLPVHISIGFKIQFDDIRQRMTFKLSA